MIDFPKTRTRKTLIYRNLSVVLPLTIPCDVWCIHPLDGCFQSGCFRFSFDPVPRDARAKHRVHAMHPQRYTEVCCSPRGNFVVTDVETLPVLYACFSSCAYPAKLLQLGQFPGGSSRLARISTWILAPAPREKCFLKQRTRAVCLASPRLASPCSINELSHASVPTRALEFSRACLPDEPHARIPAIGTFWPSNRANRIDYTPCVHVHVHARARAYMCVRVRVCVHI